MNSKVFMRKFRAKLTRFEGKLLTCCGHEDKMIEAVQVREELEKMVQEELDRVIHSWETTTKLHNDCLQAKGFVKDLV